MIAMPAPAIRYASGAQCPTRPETTDGKPENSAADDRVDHQRREAPATDGAHQAGRLRARLRPLRVFVFFTSRESALRCSCVAPSKKNRASVSQVPMSHSTLPSAHPDAKPCHPDASGQDRWDLY